MGRSYREAVATRSEADRQCLERRVADAATGHAKPAQAVERQRAGVGRTVARVVDVQRVAATVAVDGQQRANGIDVAADQRRGAADVDRVVLAAGVDRQCRANRAHVDGVAAGTGVHRRRPGIAQHVRGVASVVRVQHRGAGVGRGDGVDVAARAEADVQCLERAVADAAGHAQAVQRGVGQQAGVARAVASVVDVQRVAAAIAVDGQQRANGVDVAADPHCVAADDDGVIAGAGRDRRRAADRRHIHRVGAVARGQRRGGARQGREDRNGVATRAERDIQRLDRRIRDACSHRQPGDRRRRDRGRQVQWRRRHDVQYVAVIATVDRQRPGDATRRRHVVVGQSGDVDVDSVGAGVGVDRRCAGDGIDRDMVGPATGVDRAGTVTHRAADVQRVVATAQGQVERLEGCVSDTAGRAHAQAGDAGRLHAAGEVSHGAGRVDQHQVVAHSADDLDLVEDAGQGAASRGCRRRDPDSVVVGAEVDDHFCIRATDIDRVVTVAGKDLQRLAVAHQRDVVAVASSVDRRQVSGGTVDGNGVDAAERQHIQCSDLAVLHRRAASDVDRGAADGHGVGALGRLYV